MNDFSFYLKMGLNHVLDFSAYDHILFLIALSIVFNFTQWRKIIWLVTLFTIGHTLTLALSAYEILTINIDLIEFLIPLTIFITALFNIFNSFKKKKNSGNLNLKFALCFGLIHGLGFSNYFRMMIGQEDKKLYPLLEFALGIELAQIIIVTAILILSYFIVKQINLKKEYWVIIISLLVLLISFKMMSERIFW